MNGLYFGRIGVTAGTGDGHVGDPALVQGVRGALLFALAYIKKIIALI